MNELRPSRQTRWAVESDGILLLNQETGNVLKLTYPRAAIWDFLTRGDSRSRIACKISAIASLDTAAAGSLTEETLEELRQGKFLVLEESHG